MATITVPAEYGYVILINAIATFFALTYLGGKVMAARKKYDVQYPNLYAVPGVHKEADKFNNVQRGHQNALETYPTYLALSLIGGLKHPVIVAVGGLLWIVGRIQFSQGYSVSPENRYKTGGGLLWIGLLASLGSSVSLAYSLLTSS